MPAERRSDVETWLAAHPEDAARVQAWRTMAEALHARYDQVANEAVPQRLELERLRRQPRRWIYGCASLLTAAIVAYCGPIGFVGLLVPHAVRYLLGPSHRVLLPGCLLAGAAFLPLCDTLARNAMYWSLNQSRQLPVGVLTNVLGGAFFLYLLLKNRDRQVF